LKEVRLPADVRVRVPSYGRADGKVIATQALFPWATLVVHAFEAEAYRAGGNAVIECPDAIRGNIAKVRNWILEREFESGARVVVMMDDDYQGFLRWAHPDQTKRSTSRMLTSVEVAEFILRASVTAEEAGARLFGVGLLADKMAYRECAPLSFNSPVLGPFHCHLRHDLRYDERLPLKDDYDMFLQQMRVFRRVVRFNAYYYGCGHYHAQGGCSSYRNVERERSQFALFQRKWGGDIVRSDVSGDSRKYRVRAQKVDINPVIRVPIPGI
jgi:hypothetical protein